MNPAVDKIPFQKISDSEIVPFGVKLFMLRLDLIHPRINGNKWFKLKYNLEEVKKQNKKILLTFGGAFSNHIIATAAVGKEFGLKTIGIIRGEELNDSSNPSLKFAKQCGMKLHFVSREDYRKKDSEEFIKSLNQQFNNFYLLPEGGTNKLAVKGCSEILNHIDVPFDYVCCAVGTGGTIAGIISSLEKNQEAIGFPVLKGAEFLEKDIKQFTGERKNWILNYDYHFGGYAKTNSELLEFIDRFKKQNNVSLDSSYTGKMMYGVYDLIKKKFFEKNATVVAIHTGGVPKF